MNHETYKQTQTIKHINYELKDMLPQDVTVCGFYSPSHHQCGSIQLQLVLGLLPERLVLTGCKALKLLLYVSVPGDQS